MSLTFLHPSPNGNSLARPGITLAPEESFGLIIQLSLPFPREVRSTPIVPTLLLSRNCLKHVQEEIPEILDSNRDCVIFHQTLPLAIFHSNQTVRWKFANHLDRLFQERPSYTLSRAHPQQPNRNSCGT